MGFRLSNHQPCTESLIQTMEWHIDAYAHRGGLCRGTEHVLARINENPDLTRDERCFDEPTYLGNDYDTVNHMCHHLKHPHLVSRGLLEGSGETSLRARSEQQNFGQKDLRDRGGFYRMVTISDRT